MNSSSPKKGRILVMDDEDMTRLLLSRMLTKAGYEVELTSDGFEALELVQRRCSVPVITLTARSKEISLGKHRSTDSADYVRMPFHTRELVACVEAKLQ